LNDETRQLVIRRDVTFNETDFNIHRNESETKMIESKETVDDGCVQTLNQVDQPRHSERQRQPPVRFGYKEYADAMTETVEHLCRAPLKLRPYGAIQMCILLLLLLSGFIMLLIMCVRFLNPEL